MNPSLFIVFTLIYSAVLGQNLVPNPSFEEYSDCPDNAGQIDLATGWGGLGGLPDYYHECGMNGLGVPINHFGGGYARSGQGYTLVAVWAHPIPSARRYIGIELVESLTEGVSYHAEFFVSMMDSLWYATRNIGIHFSSNPHSQDISELLNLTPQVSYSDTGFLTDKTRWVKIAGSFIAQGGERYLAIGNFDSDSETDTTFVPGGGTYAVQSEGFWNVAAYFVDDVLVIPDSIYLGMEDMPRRESSINLYPNPNSGEFVIDLRMDETNDVSLQVVSITGQMVHQVNIVSNHQTIRINTSPGLYLYRVTVNGESKWTGKISIANE